MVASAVHRGTGRSRGVAAVALTVILLAVVLAAGPPPAHADGAVWNLDGCSTGSLPPNDDGSTDELALPFTVNFFGEAYSSLFVNNNGNVTFGQPLSSYTPQGLTTNIGVEIIAPFWADVDTRGAGAVTFGTTTFEGRDAFCVIWDRVGYYSSQTNKLNTFQLLLVDASTGAPDTAGDFDIFYAYDQIQWETGDASGGSNGLGGNSARVGYTAGTGVDGTFYELPGSGVHGAFLDSDPSTGEPNPQALTRNTNEPFSLDAGQWRFAVRGGGLPTGGTVAGTVTDGTGAALEGAPVSACNSVHRCRNTVTNASGNYALSPLSPGSDWTVQASAPPGSGLLSQSVGPLTVVINETTAQDFVLTGPTPPPPGTIVEGSGTTANGLPSVYYGNPFRITTQNCADATSATWQLLQSDEVLASGAMTMTPGSAVGGVAEWVAEVPELRPRSGVAHVVLAFECPTGPVIVEFDIYIDPAGNVYDQNGNPIEGATVTLFRSDEETGPFTQVPDGSAIMSPENRQNPDLTDANGFFSWLTVPGWYVVRAEAAGCTAPGGSPAYVETDALPVPPEQLGLVLTLECEDVGVPNRPPEIVTEAVTLEGNTTGGYSGPIPGVSVTDPDGDDVTLGNDAPDPLPLGLTVVTWEATDTHGAAATETQDVTVEDTTAPSLACPQDVSGTYGGPIALGSPQVSDVVDAAPTVSNDAPSSYPPGTTDVTWTATDASGNASTCVQLVTATYVFDGFRPPVEDGRLTATAGSAIPFKWGLQDAAGQAVGGQDVVTGYGFSPGGDATFRLNYDADEEQFVLVANTPRVWRGSVRTFWLELDDGTRHDVTVTFR